MNRDLIRPAVARVARLLLASTQRPNGRRSPVAERMESRLLFSGLDGSEVVGLPADMKTSLYTFVGDHSSSNSEKWTMNVGGHTFATSSFGEVRRDLTEYKKGETYPITVDWNDSNRFVDGEKKPDYDYRAWVDRYAAPAWTSGPTTVFGPTYFATDPSALLQKRWFGEDTNAAAGKTAYLHIPGVDVDVDSDNDGAIATPGTELAKQADTLENDTAKGKYSFATLDDSDNDGILDFADLGGITGGNFTPMDVTLSSNIQDANPNQTTINFTYASSDPSGITTTSTTPNAGTLRIWKIDASGARTASDFIASGTSYTAADLGLSPGTTKTFYIEAVRDAASSLAINLSVAVTGSVWSGVLSDITRVIASLKPEVDALTVSHNVGGAVLENAKEETDGAFVPVNNDDDDYDTANTADKDQPAGAITGENDLLPITTPKRLGNDPGNYRLEIPAGFKVWKKDDRSDEVTATTDIPANVKTTLFVEGEAKGTGVLILNWSNTAITLANADRIKLTAFEWTGPLNVPGYSIHNYKADGALGTSKWITPGSGTIKTGANTSDVTILWGEGPVVGKAIYEVNDKYTWDLGVNVVQVKLKTGAANTLTYKNPPTQSAPGSPLIVSQSPGPAMKANLSVEINGPVVTGVARGVRFMELGFIQNGKFTAKQADYDGLPKAGAGGGMGRRRMSSLEDGTWHLDHYTDAPASTPPWYDSNDQTGADGFLAASGTANIANHDFEVSDTPRVTATDMMTLTEGANADAVDRFKILFDFNLYFAVRTTQAVNGSEAIYTQRGKSSWQFDGSGTVAAGVWTKTGMGNTGSASFADVTDGSVVPVVAGTPINSLFATQTWTTIDQP